MNSFVAPPKSHLPAQTYVDNKFVTFIPFSPETIGKSGRKVFIDAKLMPQFLALVDSRSTAGIKIVKKINELKSLAGGIVSCSNLNNAFQHMELVEHVRIFYKIFQPSDPTANEAGVYINDIRAGYKGDENKAGFYRVKGSSYMASSKPMPMQADKIIDHHAAISDHENTLGDAVRSCAKHTSTDGFSSNPNNFSMFYLHSHIYNELGVWITPEQKQNNLDDAAQKLAKVLVETQAHRQAVNPGDEPLRWVIIGDGVKLLAKAISKLPSPKPNYKENLSKHKFQFIDPTIDINPIARDLLKTGASLDKTPVITGQQRNRSAVVSASFHRGQSARAINVIGNVLGEKVAGVNKDWLANTQITSNAITHAKSLISTPQNRTFIEMINQVTRIAQW
ncbi:hypothetical protein O5O45_19525 [Hahella aquimaris]|uniref:hypothetical protein n=1 Tax=Hahella sp. HNIBRBA332 TaxID=3015983 RepID=UPI00273C7B9C|nr:hypothetical protein [Hahella sp. HNIBRBA332]WLQ11921.1 hypothetical protein O5O45_19525 [Hahella sp. HNIBRBA332]